MFDKPCGIDLFIFRGASAATDSKSLVAWMPAVAKDQTRLERACASKLIILCKASAATASKRSWASTPCLAAPQQALLRPWASHSLELFETLFVVSSTSWLKSSASAPALPTRPRRYKAVAKLTAVKSAASRSKMLRTALAVAALTRASLRKMACSFLPDTCGCLRGASPFNLFGSASSTVSMQSRITAASMSTKMRTASKASTVANATPRGLFLRVCGKNTSRTAHALPSNTPMMSSTVASSGMP
mmetsp:Transcript_23156/g.80326  ORF Transcript_23156/g.80326 Transcript_23156/m.80326 type:complete len:246 (-) Transcript_23156:232-969(-)